MISRAWRLNISRGFFALPRGYSTAIQHDPSRIRNIALAAHIDSGKTTLTESILLKSSYLSSSGSVDTGSTTTDFLPAERERGITIQSASIPVKWRDWTFNLIDTPGHADFGMEVESASRVVDGAVVLIDSVEGVESQTKGVWRQLDRYGVSTRIIFLNKMDRAGSSFKASVSSLLAHRLHPNPVSLTLPISSFDPQDYAHGEPGIQGIVDLVKWQIWQWNQDGELTRHPLPRNPNDLDKLSFLPSTHPIIPHLVPARTALLENLSMFSEDLMEALLNSTSSYLEIEDRTILQHLRQAVLRNEILPVMCGSAMKNVGTELVMDYVGELLASPVDVREVDTVAHNQPLRALAWKVGWDKRRGWMTFVRVYSGKLTRQSSLINTTRNKKEKASKLLLLYANQSEEVDELPFGSVGVILGLKYTRTGDTLVMAGAPPSARSEMRDIIPPPAVVSASVIPQSHGDLGPVQEALESLSRTDPSLRVDVQEGQILVHGLGALHLEIVEGRLRDEWGVQFEFGKRRVSYREGLGSSLPASASDTRTAEIAGTTISIAFHIRPMEEGEVADPSWEGNLVVDSKGRPLPTADTGRGSPETHIAAGVASALSNSPHSSLPLSHVYVQVKSFEVPTPSSLLTGASAKIMRDLIRESGAGPIMEPFVLFKISVLEESLGKVVKDLTEHGGDLLDLGAGLQSTDGDVGGYSEDGVYIPPIWLSPSAAGSPALKSSASTGRMKRTINALAPLSRMLDYSSRLRALSGGHGQFEMLNAGYREVSESRKMEILREIGRA